MTLIELLVLATIANKIDGPPIVEEYIPILNDTDYGYQEPIDWENIQPDEHSNPLPQDDWNQDWGQDYSYSSEPPPYDFPENTTTTKPKMKM